MKTGIINQAYLDTPFEYVFFTTYPNYIYSFSLNILNISSNEGKIDLGIGESPNPMENAFYIEKNLILKPDKPYIRSGLIIQYPYRILITLHSGEIAVNMIGWEEFV